MIQFKRGNTDSWSKSKTILAPGQPGYDKDRKKLKIGDGEKTWNELPDASGLSRDEIICSEAEAKKQANENKVLNLLLKALGINTSPVITYGEEAPNKDTIGQVYLQHYDAEPEVDYVIDSGTSGIWTYQVWKSGIARCCCVLEIETSIKNILDGVALYSDNKAMSSISYPFEFYKSPAEVATLHNTSSIAWLACRTENSTTHSAVYTLISPNKSESAKHFIAISVQGILK